MRRLRHEAVRRLKPYRRSAAVLGAARYLTAVFCMIAGARTQPAVQTVPVLRQWYPAGALLTAVLALTPLRRICDMIFSFTDLSDNLMCIRIDKQKAECIVFVVELINNDAA